MLNKVLQNKVGVTVLVLLVSLLVAIRAFENQLFYDPFLVYFEGEYRMLPFPEFDGFHLFFSLFFRYFLNTILSLAILFFLFKDREMILFVSIVYVLFFVILIIAFFSIVYFLKNDQNLMLFYVRRFLIQPLFLIVFIPAFYFQKLEK